MRRYVKNEILDLLNTLLKANKSIKQFVSSGKRDENALASLLQDCQDAAISVGNSIEKSEGEGTNAVKQLEDYCELIYRFSIGQEKATYKLDTCINTCINEIKQLPERIEAVFLPYKASMWDSLESVWMAADEDPDCDAYVIPIPYYDKNPDGSFKAEHYEGSLYPDNIPIVDYRAYNIAERHPDLIFIHNPYDEYNHVTSVHPDYYSHVLKQYTNCLVYIPYYATSGAMSEEWSLLPSYVYADYIVVQTKDMIKFFDPVVPREKFLPLGSPKFDRVIRMCNNPPEPPVEWKKKLEGKRVYFYNTSLSGMLQDTESFLKKMQYVFDTFKEVDDACILWRPHPLLRSTFESMRREYLGAYDEIVRQFKEEDIWIYDDTPDIEVSIALSDAYIGDAGTSVISLFQVAGKKIYILNNKITEEPPEDFWKAWYFYKIRGDRDDKYCLLRGKDLYVANINQNEYDYRFVRSICNEKAEGQYFGAVERGDKIFVLPQNETDILVIEAGGAIRKIKIRNAIKGEGNFSAFWSFEEYVILIPESYSMYVRLNTITEELDYIPECKEFNAVEIEGKQMTAAKTTHKGKILFLNSDASEMMTVDLRSLEISRRCIPLNGVFRVFVKESMVLDTMWLLPYFGTEVVRWNIFTDKTEKYDLMLDGLKSISRPDRTECDKYFFSAVASLNGDVVFSPEWANKFIRLNPETGCVTEWTPPFPVVTEDRDEFFVNLGMGFFFLKPVSDELCYWYAPERKTLLMNMERGSFDEVLVSFPEDKLLENSDGFKIYDDVSTSYCCFEGICNTLRRIATDNTVGASYEKTKHDRITSRINASPNGNCGERIYAAVKG